MLCVSVRPGLHMKGRFGGLRRFPKLNREGTDSGASRPDPDATRCPSVPGPQTAPGVCLKRSPHTDCRETLEGVSGTPGGLSGWAAFCADWQAGTALKLSEMALYLAATSPGENQPPPFAQLWQKLRT